MEDQGAMRGNESTGAQNKIESQEPTRGHEPLGGQELPQWDCPRFAGRFVFFGRFAGFGFAHDTLTCRKVAIAEYSIPSERAARVMVAEETLAVNQHPNIMHPLEVFVENSRLMLILPLPNTTLFNVWRARVNEPPPEDANSAVVHWRWWIYQAAIGLFHLHDRCQFLHGKLDLRSLVLTRTGILQLAGWWSPAPVAARCFEAASASGQEPLHGQEPQTGRESATAPELEAVHSYAWAPEVMLRTPRLTAAADIWSLGVCALFLRLRDSPWKLSLEPFWLLYRLESRFGELSLSWPQCSHMPDWPAYVRWRSETFEFPGSVPALVTDHFDLWEAAVAPIEWDFDDVPSNTELAALYGMMRYDPTSRLRAQAVALMIDPESIEGFWMPVGIARGGYNN